MTSATPLPLRHSLAVWPRGGAVPRGWVGGAGQSAHFQMRDSGQVGSDFRSGRLRSPKECRGPSRAGWLDYLCGAGRVLALYTRVTGGRWKTRPSRPARCLVLATGRHRRDDPPPRRATRTATSRSQPRAPPRAGPLARPEAPRLLGSATPPRHAGNRL